MSERKHKPERHALDQEIRIAEVEEWAIEIGAGSEGKIGRHLANVNGTINRVAGPHHILPVNDVVAALDAQPGEHIPADVERTFGQVSEAFTRVEAAVGWDAKDAARSDERRLTGLL